MLKSLECVLKNEDCNKTSSCGIAHALKCSHAYDLATTKQSSNLKCSNFAIDKGDKKIKICLNPCNNTKMENKNTSEQTKKLPPLTQQIIQ